MSDSDRLNQTELAVIQAKAEIINTFLPQLFSSPKITTGGAPDSGDHDAWMMSNYPAETFLPLLGLQLIAEEDNNDVIQRFVELALPGFKGIGGFTVKQGENIAIGVMGGSQQRKIMQRPGRLSRNLWNRNWRKKAQEEGAEIAE